MPKIKFTLSEAIQLVAEDLDEKKPYTANWDFDCAICFDKINEGDEFFYLAGKKVCNNCRSSVREVLEEQV